MRKCIFNQGAFKTVHFSAKQCKTVHLPHRKTDRHHVFMAVFKKI